MRLKTLEIVGFKSFADQFRIDFQQGISSIVGPNGCGKSNVADAIRWVLGTQSPKQLRADRMESVIFSGSVKRKQLGMAEVTLTFDNSDRSLDLDYDEVSVSRRLFRSGDSEYSINGSKCRLMDITDLVVDRGLGATGYWILETRMVETILSSRPEDRRFLFDEAAGIVKYKIQRHRAELKLDSAAADLERLADIITEVEGTCRSLKKQVSAFRKHEKITGTIKSLREAVSLIESRKISQTLSEYTAELDSAGALVGELTASLSAKSTSLEGVRTEFSLVQGKLDETHRKCSELDSAIASCDRESAVISEKIESARRRIAENRARNARELERTEIYRRDMLALSEEESSMIPEIREFEALETELSSRTEEQKGRVKLAGRRLDALKKQKEQCSGLMEKAREENIRRVKEEEARLQRIDLLEERKVEREAKRGFLEESTGNLRQEEHRLQRELKSACASGSELKEKAAELEKLRSSQSEVFRRASEAAAVAGEKTRRTDELLQGMDEGALGDLVEPLPGMGLAIGAFLTGFDRALPVDTVHDRNSLAGTTLAVDTGFSPKNLPRGAVPLSQCVQSCSNSILFSVLSRGILAEDRETALRWLKEGNRFVTVTSEGDIFRPEGLVRIGVAPEGAGQLELKDMLQRCRDDLEKKREFHEESRAVLADTEEKLRRVSEAVAESSRREAVLEKELESIRKQFEVSSQELFKTESEVKVISETLENLRKPSAEINASCADHLSRLKEDMSMLDSQERDLAEELSTLENRLSELLRQSDQCRFTLREKRHRTEEISQRREMLQRETDRIDELVEELAGSSEEAAKSISSMKINLDELKKQREKLALNRTEAEEVRTSLSASRNALMEKSSGMERDVQEIRERLSKSKSAMIEKEAAAASLRAKLESIRDTIGAEDNQWLHLDSEELERKLEAEAGALERLGPVNMLAVGEYEENNRRLTYLKEQRTDLEDARESLSRAIGEINKEAAQRFRETFEQVRSNFSSMFVKLFGGGEGDIRSIESEDPLEGGIEIMARPPGKKLKNVIALSAGEKALTAVALLFSLYLVKPSPFCVLDELDGPFDDANTDKFVAILREFSADTQFIVITHNKRTMEGSDILYGITMAEQGVSTITSVSLEEMAEQ
ncbi:chromosome segregation protein SMC [Candidatus Fermentibacteria bacterium]|nr:MAG: chromosome segregation protein SMC [Candidatus Fermentibacteria bacterium]